jgi:hypothetical protein
VRILDGLFSVNAAYGCLPFSQASGDFDRPTSFQSEMTDDHLYQDPEYSWDEYIQA